MQAQDMKDRVEPHAEERRHGRALDRRKNAADAGCAAIAETRRRRSPFDSAAFRLAAGLGIEAAKVSVAPLEGIAIGRNPAAMQADIDNLASRFGLVAEVALEQDAHVLIRLERRPEIGEAADKLNDFANDRLRHAVAQPGAIDAVGESEMRRGVDRPAGILEQSRRDDRLGGLVVPAVVLRTRS